MRIPESVKNKYYDLQVSGIYKITFISTGVFYIGSSFNIFKRFKNKTRSYIGGY